MSRGSDYFYVHFDKAKSQYFESWKRRIEEGCKTKNVTIVSEFNCKWSSFGIVDATLSAMNFFSNLNYDYLINLTGEDYPIKSTRQIDCFFEKKDLGFLTFWMLPYAGWYKGGLNRINNRFFCLPKRGYPYVRLLQIPRIKKGLPGNFQAYGGWSLFCLPKVMVDYIVDFTRNNSNFKSFFKHVHAPGEMYFQTVLLNSCFANRIINDNKRYLDFIDAHPRALTMKDFITLKESGCLFARKFNENVDKELLDRIDKEIMSENGLPGLSASHELV